MKYFILIFNTLVAFPLFASVELESRVACYRDIIGSCLGAGFMLDSTDYMVSAISKKNGLIDGAVTSKVPFPKALAKIDFSVLGKRFLMLPEKPQTPKCADVLDGGSQREVDLELSGRIGSIPPLLEAKKSSS